MKLNSNELTLESDEPLLPKSKFKPVKGVVYKIGRKKENDIIFNDICFSRVNTSFFFHSSRGWTFQDGDGKSNSTNGTWVRLTEPEVIPQEVFFRIGNNLMKIKKI